MWKKIEDVKERGEETNVMEVPQGWIVKHSSRNLGAECITFVPDKEHKWQFKEIK